MTFYWNVWWYGFVFKNYYFEENPEQFKSGYEPHLLSEVMNNNIDIQKKYFETMGMHLRYRPCWAQVVLALKEQSNAWPERGDRQNGGASFEIYMEAMKKIAVDKQRKNNKNPKNVKSLGWALFQIQGPVEESYPKKIPSGYAGQYDWLFSQRWCWLSHSDAS